MADRDSQLHSHQPPATSTWARSASGNRLESPSLLPRRLAGAAAFELKFLLPESVALDLEAERPAELGLDDHGEASLGGAYRIASLYCDTPTFAVLRREGRHRASKYRIRRYGDSEVVFLERKTRRGVKVRKRRVAIDLADLARCGSQTPAPSAEPGWPGASYAAELDRHNLAPVCRISYQRRAYVGLLDGLPARMTFDRHVRGDRADGWVHERRSDGVPIVTGVIAELKWRGALPARFKEVVQRIESVGVLPGGVSKYRRCANALGLCPDRPPAGSPRNDAHA